MNSLFPILAASGATLALAATLLLPLGLLVLAAASRGWRWLPRTLGLAPLPGLAAALLWRDGAILVLDPDGLRLTLGLDRPRALLLGATALLWSLAGAYAGTYLRGDRQAGRFAVYWLLTLTGCLGVFLAGDLASFYLLYSLMSLAAYGLVVHDGTPAARRAATVYLVLAVLGEAFLLIAFVLLHAASPGDSLLIRDVVAALPDSPHRLQTLIFLLLGFGLKMGLVPLHGWLPLAHPAAPMPASAVLSGAIVKTGVIGFVAFVPWAAPLPDAGAVLLAMGLFSAFYAVLMGITQANPKTVLAYSTVSQMGLVAAVLGAGLGLGSADAALVAAFYAVHHVLVKGALFLAVGVAAKTPARWRWTVLAPCAVLALSFAGLPLTGGMVAKLATKPYLADGLVKLLATLSASGSALLMLHFLRRLAALPAPEGPRPAPVGLVWPWAVAGIAAVAMPWALYAVMPGGRPAEALTAQALWAALWPVLVGAGLALALFRWGRALPAVPEGDVICYGERAAREVVRWSARADTADSWLRRWPVAGAAALALALALAALLAGGLSPARDAGTPAGGAGLPRAGRPRSNAPRMDDGGLFPETRWCAGLPRVGLVALLCLAAPAGTAAEARLVTDGFAPEGAAAAHVLRTRTWLFLGPAARWGAALAAPGDITGDGLADLVVASAPAEGAPARPTAVLVIAGDRGKRPRTFRVSAPSGTDLLAAAGDVDGDGAPEWLLGRRGDAATPAVLELRGG